MMSDVIFHFCKVVALFVDPTIKSKDAVDVMDGVLWSQAPRRGF
jgi:hypothetical protein